MSRSFVYAAWLTPITNIGASGEGAEIITFFAPPFKCACVISSRFGQIKPAKTSNWNVPKPYGSCIFFGENTCWFHNVNSTTFCPGNIRWVTSRNKQSCTDVRSTCVVMTQTMRQVGNLLIVHINCFSVHNQLSTFDRDGSIKSAMGWIVPEHVHLQKNRKL